MISVAWPLGALVFYSLEWDQKENRVLTPIGLRHLIIA